MQAFVVGGAVRDELLGLPVQDHDWVVVGATPDDMIAKGFRPVGKDFPVFLHPQTHEEYALARTERKTAPGYHGFVFHTAPDVKLDATPTGVALAASSAISCCRCSVRRLRAISRSCKSARSSATAA